MLNKCLGAYIKHIGVFNEIQYEEAQNNVFTEMFCS